MLDNLFFFHFQNRVLEWSPASELSSGWAEQYLDSNLNSGCALVSKADDITGCSDLRQGALLSLLSSVGF
jgi:hypothetical protein